MTISLILAISENGVIGRNNALPWRLPADLKRFKDLTLGHAIIMGRKTWDSIGRPLPGRTSVVVSRSPGFQAQGALTAASLDEALRLAGDRGEVFVIGGAALFHEALPRADCLYLTLVHVSVEGDVFLTLDLSGGWKLVSDERREADAKNPLPFSFRVYRRM